MALKQSKLQQIPQRNKDATFGYVKECEQNYHQIVPSMIKYLILVYFNQNRDGFDDKHTHSKMQIDGNLVKLHMSTGMGSNMNVNSYLQNVVSEGIHIWIFKPDNVNVCDVIGISNVEIGSLTLDGNIDDEVDSSNNCVAGYAFILGGLRKLGKEYMINNLNSYSGYAQECDADDIIQMKLDFNNLSLSYKINEIDYGKAFDIKRGSYRAAVGVYDDNKKGSYRNAVGVSIQLISYQHIV